MSGDVRELRSANKIKEKQDDLWLRRQAVVVVTQLPESPSEALVVLDHARELVSQFLTPKKPLAS